MLALLLHSINAGIPISREISIKIAKVDEKPKNYKPSPANQIIALFFVAASPARLGDR
jgi:hypothetical protein